MHCGKIHVIVTVHGILVRTAHAYRHSLTMHTCNIQLHVYNETRTSFRNWPVFSCTNTSSMLTAKALARRRANAQPRINVSYKPTARQQR